MVNIFLARCTVIQIYCRVWNATFFKVFLVFNGTLGWMGKHTESNKPFILGSHAEYQDMSGCKQCGVK